MDVNLKMREKDAGYSRSPERGREGKRIRAEMRFNSG